MKKARGAKAKGGEAKEGFGERFLPSKTGAFMLFIPRHALHRAESTTGPGPGPPTCPFEFGIIWDTFLVGVYPISIQHRCTTASLLPLPIPEAVSRKQKGAAELQRPLTSEFSGYFRARRPSNDLRVPNRGWVVVPLETAASTDLEIAISTRAHGKIVFAPAQGEEEEEER